MTAKDTWAVGESYEPFMGRWSRLVAKAFVEWLAVPAGRDWLDVGCGTGALTQTVLETADPRSVRSIDPSEGFVAYAREQIPDARAAFDVGDARSIPMEDASVDAAVSGLVLNFVPEPSLAAAEMLRCARPGGIVAAYVWDYAGRMEMLRTFWDAAVALDPAAADLDEGNRFPLCSEAALLELFVGAGARDVEVRAMDVPTRFRDFDDYWTPFLGGQFPAPGYVATLDDDERGRLREAIRGALPISQDGSIDLIARAWAVRALKPG